MKHKISVVKALILLQTSFIKTTYDISLDSQISLLPLGFSLLGSSLIAPVSEKEREMCVLVALGLLFFNEK